jgi:hypothetical protein
VLLEQQYGQPAHIQRQDLDHTVPRAKLPSDSGSEGSYGVVCQ